MANATGPIIPVSDYMAAIPDQIRQYLPNDFATLGADGFGFSDTCQAARRYFKIDTHSIVIRTLQMLAKNGHINTPQQATQKYDLHNINAETTGTDT